MRTVFFLVQKEFLQIIRNRTMLLLMLLMPVVQTLLLSFAANFEIKNLALSVVDHDLSPMSRQLVGKFTSSGYFKLSESTFSRSEADISLARDKSDLILEIPHDFERNLIREGKTGISLTANAINASKAGLGMGYAGNIVLDFSSTVSASAGATAPGARIKMTYSNWYNPKLDYKAFMVPGILGEIVALIICFLTALNLVREREMGTMEQLNVTPVKKWQFILGKLLPFWALAMAMMAVGLTVGWLVFRIPMVGSLWLVFAYTLIFAPTMLGIGFLISNFSETQQQAMLTAWFFLLIFILMCGLFTPLDSMPQWAQWLNMLNPIQYFVAFMRQVLLKGSTFADVQQNFYTVFGYAVAVNGLAVWSYKKRN